jgi:hypothetical protein
MTRHLAAALITFTTFFVAAQAQAQAGAPDFPTTAPGAAPAAPAKPNQSPAAKARDERRQRMTPEEARRDQQLEILEARAGGGSSNTTFGRTASQSRQYDNSGGGFKVKKFKDKRPGSNSQKRGQTHYVGGIDPKGERLVDKKRRKKFLLF